MTTIYQAKKERSASALMDVRASTLKNIMFKTGNLDAIARAQAAGDPKSKFPITLAAEGCGIDPCLEDSSINLLDYAPTILSKSVLGSLYEWIYTAYELATICNRHADFWGLTPRYNPSQVNRFMDRLFEPSARGLAGGEIAHLDYIDIGRQASFEITARGNDHQLKTVYTIFNHGNELTI